MPFNGSGTFTPLSPPTFPAVAGTPITAGYYNSQILDIINQGLSLVLPRDGQAAMTGNLNMGNNRVVSVAAPIVSTDGATKGYIDTLFGSVTVGNIPKRGSSGLENSILVENLGNLDCFGDIFLTDTFPTINFNVGGPTIQGLGSSTLGIFTSGVRRVTVNNVGHVGINVSSPDYSLDILPLDASSVGYGQRVRGNAASGAGAIQFTNNAASAEYGYVGAANAGLVFAASGARSLNFFTNGLSRMLIDSSGNVNIGFGLVVGGNTVGSNAYRNVTISTSAPSGGADGDIWLRY